LPLKKTVFLTVINANSQLHKRYDPPFYFSFEIKRLKMIFFKYVFGPPEHDYGSILASNSSLNLGHDK